MEKGVLIKHLITIAQKAGAAIMKSYEFSGAAKIKKDGSPLTEADTNSESIIVDGLASLAPDIPVISEENEKSHALVAPYRFFLIDPLDGTKEFLKRDGKGAFTVNIALIEQGRPALGVVFAPALSRLFTGYYQGGAYENGKRISVRDISQERVIAVASASHRDRATNQWLSDHAIDDTVSIGSSLKFCLIAAGEADVYPRFGPTMEWDTAAGDAVLRAAGGRVCHPDGSCFAYGKPAYKNQAFIACGAYRLE